MFVVDCVDGKQKIGIDEIQATFVFSIFIFPPPVPREGRSV